MANFRENIIIFCWNKGPSTSSCAMGGLWLLRPCRSKSCHPQKTWTKRVALRWPSGLSTNLHVRRCWHQRRCTDIDHNTPSCQNITDSYPWVCVYPPPPYIRWQTPPLIALIVSLISRILMVWDKCCTWDPLLSTCCFFKLPHHATFWCLYFPISHLVHDSILLLKNLNMWSQYLRFLEWILKQDGLVIIQSLQTLLALLRER